ncbi:hypothetical protein STRTUCAR8_08543 [Streptomyces turgidiscabies Car8]|uniref:C1q domain-containing protein n=1 Tax=Streptomyces turgidiscabies (strain Car8) TaxID=698760 RepID=L7FAM0_STRT8|nr:hypothetical protein [Streptomyces turgidiscabies]ELP67710.1 hypothetical protein STRTUCAR8_08543 [Streptomyces turgidiscabies Car8]
MPRTVPASASEAPGNYLTGALWSAQVKATMDFLMGSGTNGVPRFKGWASSSQSIATGTTDVAITLDTEDYDSDNGHSTSTNTSRYTIQVAGTYRVVALGGFAANATGNRKLGININGTAVRAGSIQQQGIASNSWNGCVVTEVACSVGDYIEIAMWQTSGGSLSTAASLGFGPALMVCWISS